ncbi:MAG: hypothetical protein K8T10_16515 [Candidatus Eremiobacteraeota bacterium]|nr:hypothetical protein [Candidatus Eremiobacteraeota bacterium]
MEMQKIELKAFLVCRDVLVNSRKDSVISIINIFNELRVNKFPAELGTICLVAIYSGAPGEYTHHFEIWTRGVQVGDTPLSKFFLENSVSMFHVASYMDGVVCEQPQQFTFKSFLNGEEMGSTSLGIFKPLHDRDFEDDEFNI